MYIRSGSIAKREVAGSVRSAAMALVLVGAAMPTQAADFMLGPVQARTSAYASLGTIVRAEKADPALEAIQVGNQNFDRWDPVSTVLKATADIDLSYKNYGAFVRGNAWYDYELEKGNRPVGNAANGYTPGEPLGDSSFPREQRFSGAQLLDAYVYGEWDVAGMPVGVRAGRHALAWGESMLLGGGINVINPYDVAALRRAGSQLKEALLPVGMVSLSAGLTNELNLSAFYQYEWEATRLDQCGTFFSVFDGIQEGCTTIDFGAGAPILLGDFNKPENGGQYGFAARYFAAPLNTEFGAYYVNYHNRTPIIGMGSAGRYQIVFPEDVQVIGLSAATSLGGKSVYGEVAYRLDQPVQRDVPGVLFGGTANRGYDNFNSWNLILGSMFSVPRFLGSDELSVTAEVGYNRTQGLPGGNVYGNTTSSAWGYSLFASMTYSDAFLGINVVPSLGLNHAVNGVSADGNYVKGTVAATLGVQFEYLKNYVLDINYTANMGKKKDASGAYLNQAHDRDFIGVAVTVNF